MKNPLLFANPRVYFGEAATEALRAFNGKNIAIVTDDFMVKSGKTDYLAGFMPDARITIFSGVTPDPDVDILQTGATQFKAFQPEVIIALGGGSSLDAAKGIKVTLQEYCPEKTITLIAIPTTSGSGSEVTAYAIISDTVHGQKYPLVADQLLPDIAILDPHLVLSVPRAVAVDTGMDVLTHAIEAYLSPAANDFSDALAEKAIRLVWRYLPQVFDHEKDLAARSRMHNASCMAGMAFNAAGLGLVHGMAHALGGVFHIPHGKINAMLLPLVIDYNAANGSAETLERYARCARILGATQADKRESIQQFTRLIRAMNRRFGIPATLLELNITQADIARHRERLIQAALADGCTATNPHVPTHGDIDGLITQIAG
ncbi:1-propanol dehydrogenase PduQ [Brenneria tiliae]|uniref:1-propanol dehydrogenase PduQ n=1 Tax=Brenneria tiliae TaxID=2914984 RepID=UPI002014CC88|nr:1-propanol dehydrogenase PduQ [Brenneria tiliae]MCL2899652.1 iron-containing alcohol dehydrogenase [Brenneria tiliae]MCL2904030.1 iron-containing alcohol dehydrogenase [Brenneria tiliae]